MTTEFLLTLLFILLMAIALPYIFKANFNTRLKKCEDQNDFQGALKILNNRWYAYLFGKFTTLFNQLKIHMANKDTEKMKEVINKVIDGNFTKKEKRFIAANSYFFYVDKQDKQYCKKLLDCLRQTAEIDEYEYDYLLFRFLVEKNASQGEVHQALEMIDQLKPQEKPNRVQIGMLQYMIGSYYLQQDDKKNAETYLNRAKNNLKQTPYHSKIKDMKY